MARLKRGSDERKKSMRVKYHCKEDHFHVLITKNDRQCILILYIDNDFCSSALHTIGKLIVIDADLLNNGKYRIACSVCCFNDVRSLPHRIKMVQVDMARKKG